MPEVQSQVEIKRILESIDRMYDQFHKKICSIIWHVPISAHPQLAPATAEAAWPCFPSTAFSPGHLSFPPATPPLLTLPLSSGAVTFTGVHHLRPEPPSVRWNQPVPKPNCDFQILESQPEIAHCKEEFVGSHDQTMASRGVDWDYGNRPRQEGACPPNPLPRHLSAVMALVSPPQTDLRQGRRGCDQ